MAWVAWGIVLSVMVRKGELELRRNIQIEFWIKDLSSCFQELILTAMLLIIYFN